MADIIITLQAWAYLLGVAYNGEKEKYPRTTVDILPSTPEHYTKLYQRYQELFKVIFEHLRQQKLGNVI